MIVEGLAENVADMSRHVTDDTPCCSNFGQMGPCRRHNFFDVVAVCVGLSRHLPEFPKCVCRNILWYGSAYAQILSHDHALNAHFMGQKVADDKFVMFSPVGFSCSPSLSCSPTDYATDACSLRCIFATFLTNSSTSLNHTSTSSSPIGKLD